MKHPELYEINNDTPENKKRYIQNLFNSIVPTYDLLNRILSGGIDILWRINIFRHIESVRNRSVIDLCCGTGDLSKLIHRKGANLVSLDFSINMLEAGLKNKRLPGHLLAADATKIPVKSNSFHAATIAFGIRNIPDLDNFLIEVNRILKPGGKLAILELVRPDNKFIGMLYAIYLGKILPLIGGVVSGKRFAYQYLSKTIETFLEPDDLEQMLKKYGFSEVTQHPQTFGVSTIMICRKDDK